MKILTKIFYGLCVLIFTSCDPAYEYTIIAKSQSSYLECYPSLETLKNPTKELREFVNKNRITTDSPFIYKITKGDKINVLQGLGFKGYLADFPFTYLKFYNFKDLVVFIGQDNIMSKFIRKFNRKYILEL